MRMVYYETRTGTMAGYLTPEYNSMYFKREDNSALWTEVSKLLAMLMANRMEAKVHDEGVGVVVQWNYDPSWGGTDYGNDRLMWVSSDEEELINDHRRNDMDDIVKRFIRELPAAFTVREGGEEDDNI